MKILTNPFANYFLNILLDNLDHHFRYKLLRTKSRKFPSVVKLFIELFGQMFSRMDVGVNVLVHSGPEVVFILILHN